MLFIRVNEHLDSEQKFNAPFAVGADAVLKGTTVDSVFECHQRSNSRVPFEHVSFRELLARGFTAMDTTAITFCEENNIPGQSCGHLMPAGTCFCICYLPALLTWTILLLQLWSSIFWNLGTFRGRFVETKWAPLLTSREGSVDVIYSNLGVVLAAVV